MAIRSGISFAGAIISTLFLASNTLAEDVEVLHWWTSGGEAAALNVLKQDLEKQGVTWNDMPVAGGGGEQANAVVRSRVNGGNPPTSVQMLGFVIRDWAREGALSDLSSVANQDDWENLIPDAIKKFSKYNGQWVAAPVNAHSTNWVWANKRIFHQLNITPPQTWDEFINALQKIQDAGFVALAHGGQAWQDSTVFEGVLLATGGMEFYRKVFIDLDPSALNSKMMVKVFSRMNQLRGFVDDNFSGRDWNLASAMVINSQAGMQIMGDWAKGEFLNAGMIPYVDFYCFRIPQTQGLVTFNSDQFGMFKVSVDKVSAQEKFARAIMNPEFQSAFNVVKGSVPARNDVPDTAFDICGKKGIADLKFADSTGGLEGSFAHGYAVAESLKNAFFDVITAHFNGDLTSEEAAEEFVFAVEDYN